MERGICIVCNDKPVTMRGRKPDGTVIWKNKCWRHSITDDRYKRHQEKNRINQIENGFRASKTQAWKKRGIIMTIEKYNKMVSKVEGKCEICGVHESKLKKRLAVDHNHGTGKIRGLLCYRCNMAIGFFYDDIKIIKKAIKYLINNFA